MWRIGWHLYQVYFRCSWSWCWWKQECNFASGSVAVAALAGGGAAPAEQHSSRVKEESASWKERGVQTCELFFALLKSIYVVNVRH